MRTADCTFVESQLYGADNFFQTLPDLRERGWLAERSQPHGRGDELQSHRHALEGTGHAPIDPARDRRSNETQAIQGTRAHGAKTRSRQHRESLSGWGRARLFRLGF